NPLLKVTKPKEPRGRVRFLADDERERFLTACRESSNKDLYPAVILALSTGARQQEIMGLRWPQVDLARRAATLHDTKNGEVRVLPLAGPALDLLRERSKVRRLDTDLIFPGHTRPAKPI
ncbi:site-specific integrase, partial [bacterium]|nr:site-specific integrase [bacterium]